MLRFWTVRLRAFAWRGFRPTITVEGFRSDYLPSEQPAKAGLGWENFDRRFTGALVALDFTRYGARGNATTRVGYTTGNSENPTLGGAARERWLGFAALGNSLTVEPQPRTSVTFQWQADVALGRADDTDVFRRSLDTRFTLQNPQGGFSLRARGGEFPDRLRARVVAGELVAAGEQVAGGCGAHRAEPDHRDLHLGPWVRSPLGAEVCGGGARMRAARSFQGMSMRVRTWRSTLRANAGSA